MRLTRWLLWSMLSLSVVAALAAAGWWWVTWPERTAREFAKLFGAAQVEAADRMLIKDAQCVLFTPSPEEWPEEWKQPFVGMCPRTWGDVLCGRSQAKFKMFGGAISVDRGSGLGFTMVLNPSAWPKVRQ